jgi:hypothetical protein
MTNIKTIISLDCDECEIRKEPASVIYSFSVRSAISEENKSFCSIKCMMKWIKREIKE